MTEEDFLKTQGEQDTPVTELDLTVEPPNTAIVDERGSLCADDLETTPVKLNYRQEIELRKAKQREEDEANLTFKPQINKPQRRESLGTSKENRFDKLYSDALKRHISTHIKEESRGKEKDYSFTPQLVSRPGSRSNSRSHSRNNSRQRQREDHSAESQRPEVEFLGEEPNNSRLAGEPSLLDRLSVTTTRRKEAQSPAAAKEMTFSPAISKRAKAIETIGGKEVTMRLFEHSKTANEKIEQRRNEIIQKEMENCPFSPQLATRSRPNSAQRARSGAHSGLNNSSNSVNVSASINLSQSLATTQRLYRYEEEKKHKLEEARKAKEEKEMQGVTFQPQFVTKRPATPSQIRVHDRLANPIEKSVSPQVALAYAEYTFHPKLISKKSPSPVRYSADFANIHDRLFEQSKTLEKEKLEHVEQLRQSLETECTFRPRLSTDGSPQRDQVGASFERLLQPNRSPERMHQVEQDMFRECTYTPVLSTRSYHIAQHIKSTQHSENTTVFERLVEEEELKKQEDERRQREKERQEEERLKECSFQPVIPRRSSMLSSRSIDMTSDVHTRLSNAKTISRSMSVCQNSNFIDPHGIINDNVSLFGGSNPDFDSRSVMGFSVSQQKEEPQVKRIVKEEKELKSLFERLSAPAVRAEASPQRSSVIVPKSDVEAIVERLAKHRTKSVILRNEEDPEAARMIKEFSLLKEVARIPTVELDNVIDRLRSHTVATAVAQDLKTLSRSMSMDFSGGGGNFSDTASVASSVMSSSPSALQAALSSNRLVRRKSFVQSLENSYSPLNGIPRSMSKDEDNDRLRSFGLYSPASTISSVPNQFAEQDRRSAGNSPLPNAGNRSPISVNTDFRGLRVDTSASSPIPGTGIAMSPSGAYSGATGTSNNNSNSSSPIAAATTVMPVGKVSPRLSRSLSSIRIFEEIQEGNEEEERDESDIKKPVSPVQKQSVSEDSTKQSQLPLTDSAKEIIVESPVEKSASPAAVAVHSPRKGLTNHRDSFRYAQTRLTPSPTAKKSPMGSSTPVSIKGRVKSNPGTPVSAAATPVQDKNSPVTPQPVSPRVVRELSLLPTLDSSFIITRENGREVLREALPSPAVKSPFNAKEAVLPPTPPTATQEQQSVVDVQPKEVDEQKETNANPIEKAEIQQDETIVQVAESQPVAVDPVAVDVKSLIDQDTEDFLNSIPQVSVDDED